MNTRIGATRAGKLDLAPQKGLEGAPELARNGRLAALLGKTRIGGPVVPQAKDERPRSGRGGFGRGHDESFLARPARSG